MKNRSNFTLLLLWLVSTVACVINWLTFINLPSFILPVIPAFCSQFLLCRLSRRWFVLALPWLPVLGLLGIAGWYAIFGSGWDMLASLIFGLAAIAPAVGAGIGWLVWWLTIRKRKNLPLKEC